MAIYRPETASVSDCRLEMMGVFGCCLKTIARIRRLCHDEPDAAATPRQRWNKGWLPSRQTMQM